MFLTCYLDCSFPSQLCCFGGSLTSTRSVSLASEFCSDAADDGHLGLVAMQKFRAYILSDEKRTVDVMTYTVFTSLSLKDNLGQSTGPPL